MGTPGVCHCHDTKIPDLHAKPLFLDEIVMRQVLVKRWERHSLAGVVRRLPLELVDIGGYVVLLV